jgi:plasmid stability protein
MPPELRERLEARAKKNGRSANAEIVAMVIASLDADLSAVPTEVLLSTAVKRLDGVLQLVVPPDAAEKAGGVQPKRPRKT